MMTTDEKLTLQYSKQFLKKEYPNSKRWRLLRRSKNTNKKIVNRVFEDGNGIEKILDRASARKIENMVLRKNLSRLA